MAGPNDKRGPSSEDESRMADIRSKQASPSGDPRLSGQRGTQESPIWVRSADDPVSAFFDQTREPTSAEGPQRPNEDDGGESQFRAMIKGQEALSEAVKSTVSQMRTASQMLNQYTVDLSAYGRTMKESRAQEADRIGRVLDRIEKTLAGEETRKSKSTDREDHDQRSGRHQGIPDLDDPQPNGTFPSVTPPTQPAPPSPPPPPPPGGGTPPGGGGSGGSDGPGEPDDDSEGSEPRKARHRSQGPSRPHSETNLRTHEGTYLRDQHMGGLRRRIQRETAESYHQTFGQGTDHNPTPIRVEKDDGSVAYQLHGASGQVGPDLTEEEAADRGLLKKARNAYMISRVAGGFARGGGKGALRGAMGGLGTIASQASAAGAAGGGAAGAAGVAGALGTVAKLGTKAVPFVGTALAVAEAGNEALKWGQEQRAKNAFYQNIQGGTNFAGFGERLREEGFVWGERLGVGMQEEDARKMFKGVSSMGFTGENRDRMTQFGARNYKNMGMGVDQTLKAISIAAAGANTTLAGLEKSLVSVTGQARKTGQSADVMRDKFLDVYAAATKSSANAESTDVAAALTNSGAGQGREYANVDQSGVLGEGNQRLLASQMGVSYAQLMGQRARGNEGPMLEAQSRLARSTVSNLMTPGQRQTVDQMTQEAGGDPNKVDAQELGNRLMEGGMDPGVARTVLQSRGIDVAGLSESEVIPYAAKVMLGQADPAKEYQVEREKESIRAIGEGDRAERGLLDSPVGETPSKFVEENSKQGIIDGALGIFGESGKADLAEKYGERQSETGQVEPAIEAMISQLGDDENTGIEVDTGDGKKVVSMDEAMKYYPDQVNKGTARVISNDPEQDGKALGEVTGVKSDNVEGPDTSKEPAKKEGFWESLNPFSDGGGEGVSAEDWKKDHGGEEEGGGAGGGKVKIEASEELRRFLKISGEGNVDDSQVTEAASAGVPPAPGGLPR